LTIREIRYVNSNFSHERGAGGAPVPAHYDVTFIDDAGRLQTQRFRRDAAEGGRRAFTPDETAAMQQDDETERMRARERRWRNERARNRGRGGFIERGVLGLLARLNFWGTVGVGVLNASGAIDAVDEYNAALGIQNDQVHAVGENFIRRRLASIMGRIARG